MKIINYKQRPLPVQHIEVVAVPELPNRHGAFNFTAWEDIAHWCGGTWATVDGLLTLRFKGLHHWRWSAVPGKHAVVYNLSEGKFYSVELEQLHHLYELAPGVQR